MRESRVWACVDPSTCFSKGGLAKEIFSAVQFGFALQVKGHGNSAESNARAACSHSAAVRRVC
jgi:hypothetical protein